MAGTVTRGKSSGQEGYQRQNFNVITDARTPTSEEMAGRMRRYAITMGFRTACFIAMIFVPGPLRWVLFGCAVFLPYIAVVLANQAHDRGRSRRPTEVQPITAKQITTGPADGEVITGDLLDDDLGSPSDPRDPRASGDGSTWRGPEPDDRVA